jgi:hypothetical protein
MVKAHSAIDQALRQPHLPLVPEYTTTAAEQTERLQDSHASRLYRHQTACCRNACCCFVAVLPLSCFHLSSPHSPASKVRRYQDLYREAGLRQELRARERFERPRDKAKRCGARSFCETGPAGSDLGNGCF